MRFAMFLTKGVVIGCLCAGALVVECVRRWTWDADQSNRECGCGGLAPAAPGTQANRAGQAVATALSEPRSGDLHVTKECFRVHGPGRDPSARSRRRTSRRLRSARGSSMPRRLVRPRWTAMSSSTRRGGATTRRSAIAHSILRLVSGCARSRAGPGSSRTSGHVRRSRTSVEPTGPGTGRTAKSARLNREDSRALPPVSPSLRFCCRVRCLLILAGRIPRLPRLALRLRFRFQPLLRLTTLWCCGLCHVSSFLLTV